MLPTLGTVSCVLRGRRRPTKAGPALSEARRNSGELTGKQGALLDRARRLLMLVREIERDVEHRQEIHDEQEQLNRNVESICNAAHHLDCRSLTSGFKQREMRLANHIRESCRRSRGVRER